MVLLARRSTSNPCLPVTDNTAVSARQLRVAAPVEQLWHRVPGGTARATKETLVALASHAEVNIQGLAAWHRRTARAVAGELGPVSYSLLPRPALYESWLRLGRPLVEDMIGPVDVVWASSMIAVPTASAPLVATVHDLGFLDRPEHNSRRGRSFFPRAWDAVRQRADRFVCPSRVVARSCEEHGVAAERIDVVPWGVSAPISTADSAAAVCSRYDLPERFVLWVGTLEPRKNLWRLVEAVRRLPSTELVVVGPTGWNIDGADVLAPLGERVHRLGYVDEHQLSSLYRRAAVFAYPSLLEGFGLPVLEAMAHGTPVVTGAGTATEEVAAGAARLVDPLDPVAISAAIEAALDNDQDTRDLVARGRKRAQELTWSATADRYAAIFRTVVGN